MKNVWIVIGNRNTGKSSIIRALTGIGKRKEFEIETKKKEILKFWAEISSLQEREKESIDEFINRMKKMPDNILIPLWINEKKKKPRMWPDAETYIKAFISREWNIKEIIVLGQDKWLASLPKGFPEPLYLPDVQNIPINASARKVRRKWGWK